MVDQVGLVRRMSGMSASEIEQAGFDLLKDSIHPMTTETAVSTMRAAQAAAFFALAMLRREAQ
ncbi:hypothetical protein CS0771_28420 [Catellatospora sp. IY07-71]|nr:hypothetical protein CS0771_28420 [Catellatospora sp. IY07-71]